MAFIYDLELYEPQAAGGVDEIRRKHPSKGKMHVRSTHSMVCTMDCMVLLCKEQNKIDTKRPPSSLS